MDEGTKNEAICRIIEEIGRLKLFTNTEVNKLVHQHLRAHPDGVDGAHFVLTFGEPTHEQECSDCRQTRPASEFGYYQARIDKHGYLARSNAQCAKCRARNEKRRQKILAEDEANIPPKPGPDDLCPNCNRKPPGGTWHRDHDYNTHKFRRWVCNTCNMALMNKRNPEGQNHEL